MSAQASVTPVTTVPSPSKQRGLRKAVRTLWQDKAAFFGACFLLLLVVVAIFAPVLAPYSPTEGVLLDRFRPPFWAAGGSTEYLLGTDSLGRDMLSRLMYGARISLFIGISVVLLSGVVGTALGLLAGYKGGRWDVVIMRTADAQLAFPGLLLVLMVLTFLGSSVGVIIVVVAVYGWMIYARLLRSMVLQLRETPAIQSAKLLGASTPRILLKHLLPMLYSVLLTQGILELARVVLVEASLSYLGLGIQPPNASWGLMVAENQGDLGTAWWTVVLPGVALALTVLAMNLVANFLRVQTDPQQRQRRFALGSMKGRKSAGFRTAKDDVAASPDGPGDDVPALLRVEGLDVTFHSVEGEVPAVRDASFLIRPGETVGIVGESGSGKSTTALALMDLIPPPGRVENVRLTWEGEPLDRRRLHELRGSDIAMIFQDPMTSLNPLVKIGRQVGETLIKHKGMTPEQADERTVELFEMVGIPSPRERLDQFPHELSGGLRQRVMIAAALAPEPKLVIADEPTTALDATIQAQILEIVAELQERLGVAMLLITHDLGVVARVCDRVVVMYGGRIVEEAPVFDLFERPRHRYTQALLDAVPRVDHVRGQLSTIPGYPPARLEAVDGCPFAPRCTNATEACGAMPPVSTTAPLRRFSCWHPVERSVEEVTS